ncbi:MAG: acyl-CoA dehydrogenase, partial [Actinomycetota bacterium]
VREWVEVLAVDGIGALGYPREAGGGGDPGGFIAAFSALAHHDLSLLTKFGVQFGLFAGAVMRLGTDRHRELLARAISGQEWGCFAMTETGHGSHVAGLETMATYLADTQEFEIHTPHPRARKDYIGNAASDGRTAVVFARLLTDQLDHGVHAFIVPIRDGRGAPHQGVEIGDDGPKAGLNGVDNGWLVFDRVRVPVHALLDRFAGVSPEGEYHSDIPSPSRRFFTTLGTLVGGRVSVASAAVSVAETALTIAVRYAHRRRQFASEGSEERRLISYRTHQARLMPRLAATYAYHVAAAEVAAEYVELESSPGDTDADRREFEGRAAGLKAFASWHALDTVAECRQACGGLGYMAENRLGPMAADADVFTTYEGDNTVLAQLLAKALLTDYRSSFEDLTPGRLLRYVLDRVGGVVAETVPVVGSVGGELDDPEVGAALMSRRSRQLLQTLADRIKARVDAGMDATSAFLDVQPHSLALARTATELGVLESFRRVKAVDPGVDTTLDRMAALFALWRIQADIGGYLTSGLVTSNGAGEIRALVASLSRDLADESLHLVDAFGIPPEVVGAPIAR